MPNFFKGVGEFLLGKEPEIKQQQIEDRIKTDVSRPLSQFLSSKIGQGLPAYGKPLSTELEGESKFKDFLNIDPGEFFDKEIAQPSTQRFMEDMLPVIREGFAGELRGSGREGTETVAASKFARDLGIQGAEFKLALPAAQFEMASKMKAQRDTDARVEYAAWMKTLPELNPLIQQTLQFLGAPSGMDTVTALDPGSGGLINDFVRAVGGVCGAGGGGTDRTGSQGTQSAGNSASSSNFSQSRTDLGL